MAVHVEERIVIARTFAWIGIATLAAGCGSTPSYYTQRMAEPSVAAPVVSNAETARETPARRVVQRRDASRTTTGEGATAGETTGSIRTPAHPDNPGAAAADPPARAERDRRAQTAHERREHSVRRSIDSICRGC
jgi:hypothetical protein